MIKGKALFAIFSACSCAIIIQSNARGQFYAPETEYHDPVQRVFVVEVARVLASWMDPQGTNFVEVAYSVTTKPDQTTSWDLRWFDKGGNPIKKLTVSYPASLLTAGPEFYRSVFKQVWMADWKGPSSFDAKRVKEGFWQGAAKMGRSREESLRAAIKIAEKRDSQSEAEWVPPLAGLLVHCTLPTFAEGVTLDRVLLGRGAAWLALAEYRTSEKLDELWAPILFQAGREKAASQAWQSNVPAKLEQPTPQQGGWNIWLRRPLSKDIFLFAADSTNLPMAMAMMAYDVRANETENTLAEVIEPLVGSSQKVLAFHNYAPMFETSTTVAAGHLFGIAPPYAIDDWLSLLASYTPGANDYKGYTKVLSQATNAAPGRLHEDEAADPSLRGFREAVPLLQLAHSEGIGKLPPTAVATARDLLNYGWEMTGWQMGARYIFVRYRWGISDVAEDVFKTVTAVDGLVPFFRRAQYAGIDNYADCLGRLQMLDGLFGFVGFSPYPPDTKAVTTAGARLFVKRAWLRPRDFEWQARMLWDGETIREIPALIESLQEQGGQMAASSILAYLNSLDAESLRTLPKGEEMKLSVGESITQVTPAKVKAIFDRKFRDLDNFYRGQEYEKLYWQNPDAGLEHRILLHYTVSGGFKSARRFYSQARGDFRDPIAFSNGGGRYLYILAFCSNDASLRKQVLEDIQSGSQYDMVMNIFEAAIRDSPRDLARNVSELIERYEQNQGANSAGRRLQSFLPLLPALRDTNHVSHRAALEYFGKEGGWTTLRFIWIEKFKMPIQDAIAFLGGRENDPLKMAIIYYLEKDQSNMLDALNKIFKDDNVAGEQKVLVACLYDRIHPLTLPEDATDLKPPGAVSITQAVLEKLKKQGVSER